ncbi:MAG: A/G-specific adenine glycosylase, partial [Trueperaceae bacterium]|nr:A/G-specific adenine glycosylase [Trueperaceae bacterium]
MTNDLLTWFHRLKRDLPWRKNRNPYRVWLSEVMLQQTQVATVIPYFERWLERFPTISDLAQASFDEVLKSWEGLGYYRRAKNLHRAAQKVAFELEGRFPETYEAWLELPGIGPYSAAAISSIVNGERVVAVDGNVKRVASRLFLLKGEPQEALVRENLSPYLPETCPGDFNEAMMELGATLCKKQTPACLYCPLTSHCLAYQQGKTADYPEAKKKTKRPHYEKYALIDIQDGKIWLRQRSETEMLNGLWGFVLVDDVNDEVKRLERVTHAYTHFSLGVTPVLEKASNSDGEYIPLENLDTLALSTLDRKIL